jgi:hypothetical protein
VSEARAQQERVRAVDIREVSDAWSDPGSMSAVLEHLAAVHWTALAVAIAFQISKLLVRSRAWHNLLRAAFPGVRLSWPATAGAVLVSAGVNSAAPARLGDLVKIAVVRRGLAGRCCLPTLGATMVAEAALDVALAALLVAGVVLSGQLITPAEAAAAAVRVAHGAAGSPWLVAAAVGGGLAAVLLVRHAARGRTGPARRFSEGVRRGLSALNDPGRYARDVASWQLLAWLLRIGCVLFALRAFGIEATPTVALLVVAAQIISGAVPVAGGAGVQQALVVVALQGHAGVAEAVAFSLGLQATVALTNGVLAAGVAAVAVQRIGLGGVRTLAARRPLPEAL